MQESPVKYAALLVPHNCNLRCRYCYAGDKINKCMAPEATRKTIDFLAGRTDDTCMITFFGGEPHLEFDLMRDIFLYSREKYGRRIEFRMSTNGTLIHPDILAFLKEHDFYFVLSINGHQKQHARCRRFADDCAVFIPK